MIRFPADDKHVRAVGRTLFHNGIRYLSWSCSAVEFVFTGKEVTAEIWTDWVHDEPWKTIFQPYTAVFVNGELHKKIPVSEGTNSYTIYKSETAETVKIRIAKVSEAEFGKTGIVSISADGEPSPTEQPDRRMEFVGDSITCGFGIEGQSPEEHFSTATENPYKTYAALTAEHFGAEANFVSWTGIGLYTSGADEKDEPLTDWVMPEIYCRTDAGLEGVIGTERVLWDFEKFVPQVIVVNLGTNDSIYTRDIPERAEKFKAAYVDFLGLVREKNPETHIICVLGMMGGVLGGKLFPQVREAVRETGDKRIYALELEEQQSGGIGCENHPNEITHKIAAEKLIEFIEQNILRDK